MKEMTAAERRLRRALWVTQCCLAVSAGIGAAAVYHVLKLSEEVVDLRAQNAILKANATPEKISTHAIQNQALFQTQLTR